MNYLILKSFETDDNGNVEKRDYIYRFQTKEEGAKAEEEALTILKSFVAEFIVENKQDINYFDEIDNGIILYMQDYEGYYNVSFTLLNLDKAAEIKDVSTDLYDEAKEILDETGNDCDFFE